MKYGALIICIFFTTLSLKAQQYFCIDSIYLGNIGTTKRALLIRELNFNKNDCIPKDSLASQLQVAEQRLMNTRLFNKVVATTIVDSGKKIVHIEVKKRFPVFPIPNLEFADRNFNVWWKEHHHQLDRLNVGLTLLHNNFRGVREQVEAGIQLGYTKKILLSFEKPFIDRNHQFGLGASLSYLQNKELAYATDSNKLKFIRMEETAALKLTEGAVWLSYRPRFATIHTLKFSLQQYSINDSIANIYNPDFLGNGKKSASVLGVSYRLEYNNVDNWNYPLKGYRFIGIAQYVKMAGGEGQPSIHLQYDYYKEFSEKWHFSLIARGRKAFGKQNAYIFQKNLGYDLDFIRGYEYYVQDGDGFGLGRINLKRTLVNTEIKLPIKYFQIIPIRIYPKIYADAGYAHTKSVANNFLNNRVLYSYGFGLDIVTLYDIKIRLEYTFNKFNKHDLYIHKSGE